MSLKAFLDDDMDASASVEPLKQVISELKEELRTRHILRMQQGECSIRAGFIWSDLLTDLGRTSDHCSNIAGCVTDIAHHNMNLHESLREFRDSSVEFDRKFKNYVQKYCLRPNEKLVYDQSRL